MYNDDDGARERVIFLLGQVGLEQTFVVVVGLEKALANNVIETLG